MSKTVQECLASVEANSSDFFLGCESLDEEFSRIKKAYFRIVLKTHPDKGGNVDAFRDVQTAFELLREIFDSRGIESFASSSKTTTSKYAEVKRDFESRETPSWEYYYSAATEPVPYYRVELAKSNRSSCKQRGNAKKCTDNNIMKGEIRFGSMDMQGGSYTRWMHLNCWRVPSSVWLGLPHPDNCSDVLKYEAALVGMNEVLLCGFTELSEDERLLVVRHVMNKNNWARLTKKKSSNFRPDATSTTSSDHTSTTSSSSVLSLNMNSTNSTKTLVSRGKSSGGRFMIPLPGKNGAVPNSLAGKRVVLTGVFPELGGGSGLHLGKDKAKALIQSFGGRVTASVSGKTDVLLVGKNPGYSKVSAARSKSNIQLMSLKDLVTDVIESSPRLTEAGEGTNVTALTIKPKTMVITSFSNGYNGNSNAYYATDHELALASGTIVQEQQESVQTYRAPKPVRPKSTAKSNKPHDSAKAKKASRPVKMTVKLIQNLHT